MKPFTKILLTFALFSFGISLNLHAQCEIGEIEATPTECDSSGYFDVIISFEYANTGNQGFSIQGNNMVYGIFEYEDLPVIIYDLYGDGTTFYEFVVIDNEFTGCSNYIEFGTVDCFGGECNIWNVDVFPQDCDSGYFYVDLGFWYENVGDQGFRVQGNGNNYGNFEYADLPISIGPLDGDGVTEYEFVVIDNDIEGCSDWAAIDPVDCNGGGDCEIGELIIDDHPCDSNGMFYVYFDFDYANVSDSGFALYVNYDLYGYYFYEDLPIQNLGPFEGDGTTVYHLLVRDVETYECAEDKNFGPIECGSGGDCNIWDLVIDDHPCDNGEFYVLVDFEYEYVSEEGFALYVNNDFINEFEYDDLPLEEIGPFAGDGNTVYHFYVTDLANDSCMEDASFGPIICDSIGDCEIGEIDVTILPCNDNNEFFVLLDFDYANTGESFNVQGNGIMWGTFLYSEVPVEIGPLSGDGNTVHEFAVIDALYPDCAEDTYIDPVSCDSITEFVNFTTTISSCSAEMYELSMDFDVINAGDQGFTITGNGLEYGSYSYSQLPVSIGPLPTDGITPYHFIAKDKEQPSFGNWDRLTPFTCGSLGTEEFKNDNLVKVYPNPSKGSVTFENLYEKAVRVNVFSSTGAEAANFIMNDTYQLNELSSGMYYYILIDDSRILSKGKIIVTD